MTSLIDPGFLTRLNRLSLVARRVRPGQATGERRSTKRGTSVEFADYRDYAKGDDLRRVDWNIYARLERPFIKLFDEEEDLAVHILLDGSASMDWGTDSENKWLYARRLTAALGYIALATGDRLTVTTLHNGETALAFGPNRGQGHALRLIDWLSNLETQGATDLNAALRTYAIAGGRAGLTILISDLFSPPGYTQGITSLAARGHEVALLHLLTPDEIDPPLGGDLRLVDVETSTTQEVTIDGGMRDLYRSRLTTWREEIGTTCRTRDAIYLPVETSLPVEQLVLTELRKAGMIK